MNKFVCRKLLLFLISIFLFLPIVVDASDIVDIHLFYSSSCPHCKQEKEYLNELSKDDSSIKIHLYEVSSNKENNKLLENVQELINGESPYVPYTVIGDKHIVGFANYTKANIEKMIASCKEEGCHNIVGGIKEGTINEENIGQYIKVEDEFQGVCFDIINGIKNGTITKENIDGYIEVVEDGNTLTCQKIINGIKEGEITKENIDEYIDEKQTESVPILGEIDPKDVSLPLLAIIMGLVDGFNPCAMWILLFLISMLIGMKDRKKMMYLGSLFIVASASVYLLFMVAWLNIVMDIMTNVKWIQIIIAIVALIGGIVNIRSYIKTLGKDDGCTVVDDTKRKKIFGKIRKFTSEKSLLLASIGIVLLAVSVNIVELACSAGLPATFVNILAINKVGTNLSSIYILIYIFFFMLDDLIVFYVSMFTLKVTGLTTKYTKYTHLIGGLIMLAIGILLIFKPEWVMFNF